MQTLEYIKYSKLGKDILGIGLDEEEILYNRNSDFVVIEINIKNDLVEIINRE